MSNKICSTCGEEYSDTYRKCPFCEEDDAIRHGRPLRRQGGKRLEKQRRSNGGAGGVMMLLTAVIILGALTYVFFGDQIADAVGIRSAPQELGFLKDEEEATAPPPVEEEDTAAVPEGSLVLSQSAMTLATGETAMLTVTGAEGGIVWSSSDEAVATVADGIVTAKAGGTATISAVAGGESAACSVEVQGDPPSAADPDAQPGGDTGSTGADTGGNTGGAKLTLNKTDFSIRSGDPDVQLKVSGTGSTVKWASKDSGVAKVSDSGIVTRVASGTTTITASVDGQVLECIVRCK